MTLETSNAAARAEADAHADLYDAGASNAVIKFYEGSRPAGADVAITTQVLLGGCDMSDPAFGAAADANPGATITADTISSSTWDASGDVDFWRTEDSDGNVIDQGDCGLGGSGASCTLNSLTAVLGQPIAVTSLVLTFPESA